MKILQAYSRLSTFHRFAANTLVVGLVWFSFFYFFRYISFVHPAYEATIERFTELLLEMSQWVLLQMGEQSLIYKKSLQQIGGNGVYIDRGCLGRNLMGLFAGFILVFPGRWQSKTWFIPLGLVLIVGVNVSRIVGLYLTNKYYPQHMDINHHTVFKYTVYGLTFVLWWVWIRYLRLPRHKARPMIDDSAQTAS